MSESLARLKPRSMKVLNLKSMEADTTLCEGHVLHAQRLCLLATQHPLEQFNTLDFLKRIILEDTRRGESLTLP